MRVSGLESSGETEPMGDMAYQDSGYLPIWSVLSAIWRAFFTVVRFAS
jgi:hypothetical protein